MRGLPALCALVMAIGVAVMAITLQFASSAGGQGPAERVLILGSTVTGGDLSTEAQDAAALGFAVDVVSDAAWRSMTAAEFAAYRAIILGDPSCGTTPPAAAEGTAHVWGPQVDGNVLIVGTDPALHEEQTGTGPRELTQRGVAFAAAEPGRTGAYITLSCYYVAASTPVAAPMLAGLSGGGFLVTSSNERNEVHKTAAHPVLDGLSDADLSNWNASTHEGFTAWPGDFVPLAIACDPPSFEAPRCQTAGDGFFTAPDGTKGLVYILARGSQVRAVRSITLDPAHSAGTVGSAHTVTATLERQGQRLGGRRVEFRISAGPHAGTTAGATSDDRGVAAFTYSGRQPGTDTIVASFTDSLGLQRSDPVTRVWEAGPSPPPPPPVQPQPQPQPQPPQPSRTHVASQELPPPTVGRTVNVTPKRGTVRVKLPGTEEFVVFTAGMQVPVGTVFDTTKGRVEIVSAADRQGRTQTGEFYDGTFRIGQSVARAPVTTLRLQGPLPNVAPGRAGAGRSAAKRRRKPRRLWGDARGRFRSDGRFAAATVRGTRWLVEDHCAYTLTRVRSGSVRVRDEVRRKSVVVRKGRTYRAWAPKAVRRRCVRAARRG